MIQRIKDGLFMGMVAFIVGGSFLGCRQGGDISTVEEVRNQDTLIVLCSRLYESRTYEHYLGRWASDSLVLQLVDAGELDEGGWLKALETSNGVLLTGGADLDPGLYGQAGDTILCGDIQPIRDSIENRLLNWVNETGVPCLGICRGLQHMNVHAGGTLDPHLPRLHGDMHRAGLQGSSRDTVHSVRVVAIPHGIDVEVGNESITISHHHQGIDVLGQSLKVWAIAPDGLAEGIVHSDTAHFPFYVGVQWHPERSDQDQYLVEPVGAGFVNAMLDTQE